MARKLHRNVVRRYGGNPILGLDDLPFRANDVHNAGAARLDGEYILLVTVEELDGTCAVYRARSDDGLTFSIDDEPLLAPQPEGPMQRYETRGVRDARITPFEDRFYIVYLAESEYGTRLCLAGTSDFESVDRIGAISEPDTKNGALFPRRIGGRYARLERPREGGSIWVSYSEDLMHWGDWDLVMTPRGGFWDWHRIGAAAPPILTDCGWLALYYGVKLTMSGPLFRMGLAFLDPEDPTNVLGRSNVPILAPREPYERIGDVANLIFSCGAVLHEEPAYLTIYYGAARSCICVGTVPKSELRAICSPAIAVEGQ